MTDIEPFALHHDWKHQHADAGPLAGRPLAVEYCAQCRTRRSPAAERSTCPPGISPSTISRIGAGHRPDADALCSLIDWLRLPLSRFTVPTESP